MLMHASFHDALCLDVVAAGVVEAYMNLFY